MKLCATSFATATGEVGGYDPGRDSEYDFAFCGMPRGHSGMHVGMIWFWDEDDEQPEPRLVPPA
jgi:hypothetical protein